MFQNTNEECFSSAGKMVDTGIDISSISTKLFQQKTLASIKLDALAAERMTLLNGGKIVLSTLSQEDIDSVGGTNADTEDCINVIRSLKGSLIACILKERNGGVRGSLRSKDGTNVAAIAAEFGGGGHAAAAGFTLECSLEDAVDIVTKRLCSIDLGDAS